MINNISNDPVTKIYNKYQNKINISKNSLALIKINKSEIVAENWKDFFDKVAIINNHLYNSRLKLKINLNNEKKNSTWYRGINNAKYDILPSVFVKFNNHRKDKYKTVLRYQRYLFDQFKAKADGAIEMGQISNSNVYNTIDYLVLMQHYSVYTNLLDWSEDLMSSMYFALEKYIDLYQKDEEDRRLHENDDVAIFLFDPELYNYARRRIIKDYAPRLACIPNEMDDYINVIKKTIDQNDELLPNISSPYNQEKYHPFLHLYKNDTPLCNNPFSTLNDKNAEDEVLNLPIAILTSRLNPRIRIQSGTFVAYNLYATPQIKNNDMYYSYLALNKIQDYYINKYTNDPESPRLFLYKIIIPHQIKINFAEKLRTIGILRSHIYPELHWLGEDLVVQ